MSSNPRSQNGNLRRKNRERFKAMGLPCAICNGQYGPIHYNEPSDSKHPLSFVIDEIKPISKYKLFGYESKRAAAEDWDNLQPAHYMCNQAKGASLAYKTGLSTNRVIMRNQSDGDW